MNLYYNVRITFGEFMAIKTSTFSGWRLSGKDAETFSRQVNNPVQNPKAKAAIKRGKKLAEDYLAKGCVVITLEKKEK